MKTFKDIFEDKKREFSDAYGCQHGCEDAIKDAAKEWIIMFEEDKEECAIPNCDGCKESIAKIQWIQKFFNLEEE